MNIMNEELSALQELMAALEEQHRLIANNEIMKLSLLVEKIEECNKNLAKIEVERRRITNGESMKKIIEDLKDEKLDACYREINKLLQALKLQKDTNELLIRKGLSFSNQMMNLLKPDRSAKTYNAYGRSK